MTQPTVTPPSPPPALPPGQTAIPMDQLREQAPAATEPPKPEDKKAEVAEVKSKLREVFKRNLRGDKEEPKPEDKIATPDKKEEPKADPAKEEPKKKVKVTPKPKSNEDELVRAAADSAAAARAAVEMVQKREPKVDSAPKKSDFEVRVEALPDRYKEEIPIFQAMETKWPDKYKGIADKWAKSISKIDEYSRDWKKQNPGQEFNAKDDQHSSFFEENEVTWDERDYSRAIAAIESEGLISEERKKNAEKIRALEAKTAIQELEPSIRQRQANSAKEILKGVNPDLTDLITDDARINEKMFTKLKDEDPFTADAILSELAPLAVFIRESQKLLHPSGYFQYDQNNPAHVAIFDFFVGQERKIKMLSPAEQRDEQGRMFATTPEWNEMAESSRNRCWTIQPDQLIEYRKEAARDELKKKLEDLTDKIEKTAKFRGLTKSTDPKAGNGEAEKEAVKPSNNGHKTSGPSTTGESKTDTLASKVSNTPTDFRSMLKARLRGMSLK